MLDNPGHGPALYAMMLGIAKQRSHVSSPRFTRTTRNLRS
jgi:hypothetical protein